MLVTAIVKPEGDPVYEKFKDLHFKQYADVREAQIKQQVSIIEQETAAQRTVKMAQNEATGEYANMGIGLGVMAGVGGTMGSVMTDALSQATGTSATQPIPADTNSQQSAAKFCSECGYRFSGTEKFCPECGARRS